MRKLAYYLAVVRSAGVPEFWQEDAAADCWFASWRDGSDHPTSIRRNAIDAARRYGDGRKRLTGFVRPTMVPLEAAESVQRGDSYDSDRRLDVRKALAHLTKLQLRAIRRRIAGLPMTNLDSAHASAGRRQLRKRLAA